MSTLFPASIDSKVSPNSTDLTNTPIDPAYGNGHAAEHKFANDSIEALETKVGADGSADTDSHDYKLGLVTGSDQAAGKVYVDTLVLTANPFATFPQYYTAAMSTGGDLRTFLVAKTIPVNLNLMVFRNGALQMPGVSADYVVSGQNVIFNSALNSDDTVAIVITIASL